MGGAVNEWAVARAISRATLIALFLCIGACLHALWTASEKEAQRVRADVAEALAESNAAGWRLCEDELDRRDSLR